MNFTKGVLKTAVGIASLATSLFSQATAVPPRTFDVVSIKLNTSGTGPIMVGNQRGGRFVATNANIRMLFQMAFRPMQPYQILGGPGWLNTDRFDIQARADGTLTPSELDAAVRAMLEDRFQLRAHRETRELPMYTLTVGKDGSKLKAVDAPPTFGAGNTPSPPPPPLPGPSGALPANFTPPPGAVFSGTGNLIGSAVSMTQIVNSLSSMLGRPVVDKTDLKGYFEVRMQFTPEGISGGPLGPSGAGGPGGAPIALPGATDPSGPSILTAIQEQLGLKIESTKGQVEVVVIDSMQKPTEN